MRSAPSTFRRGVIRRQERARILVIGEGRETEPNYFEALRLEDRVRERFSLIVEPGPGFNPKAIVQHAISIRDRKSSQFDEVWCVLDVEGPDKAHSLRQARTMANAERITMILSNPSFEVWLLLHFEFFTREYSSGEIEKSFESQMEW